MGTGYSFQFTYCVYEPLNEILVLPHMHILLYFSLTEKAAPHECVIRTSQP